MNGDVDTFDVCYWYIHQCILLSFHSIPCFVLFRLQQGYDLYRHYDRILSKQGWAISRCVPAEFKAVHVCQGPAERSLFHQVAMPMLKHTAGRNARLRTKIHTGTQFQVLKEFATYGLGREQLDIAYGDLTTLLAAAKQFLEQRRKIETSAAIEAEEGGEDG